MNDKQRRIVSAYLHSGGETYEQVGARLGISPATVRYAVRTAKRQGWEMGAGGGDSRAEGDQPVAADRITSAVIPTNTTARNSEHYQSVSVSLPKFSFLSSPEPAQEPVRRIRIAPPPVTAEDEMRQRRLLMIKKIHRDGLQRGKFTVRALATREFA